ncbi:MAG: hypothetical protein IAF94_26840 [Pirellulaceae bacterium]|nr:hypothetical protein [Pirellulaceae bacterium]
MKPGDGLRQAVPANEAHRVERPAVRVLPQPVHRHDPGVLLRLLDLCQPAAGQAGGPDDLRGFEWYYWNRLAHADLFTLKGHTAALRSVAFSADGKRLASGSDDQTVKVWDATNGKETFTLKGHTSQVMSKTVLDAFAFPPNPKLASVG